MIATGSGRRRQPVADHHLGDEDGEGHQVEGHQQVDRADGHADRHEDHGRRQGPLGEAPGEPGEAGEHDQAADGGADKQRPAVHQAAAGRDGQGAGVGAGHAGHAEAGVTQGDGGGGASVAGDATRPMASGRRPTRTPANSGRNVKSTPSKLSLAISSAAVTKGSGGRPGGARHRGRRDDELRGLERRLEVVVLELVADALQVAHQDVERDRRAGGRADLGVVGDADLFARR